MDTFWLRQNRSSIGKYATMTNLADFKSYLYDTDPALSDVKREESYCESFARDARASQKLLGYNLANIQTYKVEKLKAIAADSREDNGNDNFWITVNPIPSTTFPLLKKIVERFVKHKWITSYMYVYEVRKSDYSGLHFHALCRRTDARTKKWRVREDVERTFKNVVTIIPGNKSRYSIVNIKQIDDKSANEKISYMMGNKQQKKLPSVTATNLWRKDQEIDPFYTSASSLPLLDAHTPPVLGDESFIDMAPDIV